MKLLFSETGKHTIKTGKLEEIDEISSTIISDMCLLPFHQHDIRSTQTVHKGLIELWKHKSTFYKNHVAGICEPQNFTQRH